MATKIETHLISDLSGDNADHTVAFSFDGKNYEIDLSQAEANEMRESFARYVGAARQVRARATRTARRASTADYDAQAVRAWAQANGVPVNDRGRISSDVLAQYRAAGN